MIASDIQQRIDDLELKVQELNSLDQPNYRLFSEIHSQMAIIDSLVRFYRMEDCQKLQELKRAYYQNSNDHYVYNSIAKDLRMTKMSQEIDNIFEKNVYLKDLVESQDHVIDRIGTYMDDAEDHAGQSSGELARYQNYLKRRNKFYRIIMTLILIVTVLLIAKVFV